MGLIFKLKNLLSKTKNKLVYKASHKNIRGISSYPYISCDTFLSISDSCIITQNNKVTSLKFTNKKNIIFIENDLLSKESNFEIAKKYKKVILHYGDNIPDEKLLKELVNNKIYVFATNVEFLDKYIEPIPIGIENACLGKNGNLDYYNPVNIANISTKKKNILLTSFRTQTNSEVREKYEFILKNFGYKNKLYKDLKEYRDILSSSYFVISPPGNGLDCHRTWEALIHKTIPIIERKYYLFQHLDLPILVVDDIKEFLEYSDNKKLKIYKNILKKSFEKTYAKWWLDYIIKK
ncbi:MAG: hypothetical protein JJ845_001675 [Prochlorococcus marinus CUG1436]|nr:hypothetical protein [Prochlorococcus marinus CUG1436]